MSVICWSNLWFNTILLGRLASCLDSIMSILNAISFSDGDNTRQSSRNRCEVKCNNNHMDDLIRQGYVIILDQHRHKVDMAWTNIYYDIIRQLVRQYTFCHITKRMPLHDSWRVAVFVVFINRYINAEFQLIKMSRLFLGSVLPRI